MWSPHYYQKLYLCYTCAVPVGHVKRRPGRLQTADHADHADCADSEFFTMYHFYLLFFCHYYFFT